VDKREELIMTLVDAALAEDRTERDLTTLALVDEGARGSASILARAEGTISGQDCARAVFRRLDPSGHYEAVTGDANRVGPGAIVSRIEGSLRAILTGERTALNFLGHLSGVATLTGSFVERVAHSGVVILDTRKTLPGLRDLEKEAVVHGGGQNHRRDLAGMMLIKENHIAAAGGLDRVLVGIDDEVLGGAEIEVTSLEELRILKARSPGRIMLDNFSPGELEGALKELETWGGTRPEIEVSGGIGLDNIGDFARAGVDYISIGSLTSSAPALDLSLVVEGGAQE
jgi:nicotinate-nucleotide pyrophosphorylase (carboxylating)